MRYVFEAGREAVRSVAATPRRFGLLLVIIAAAMSVLAVREAQFTSRLRTDAAARIEAGEFIYTVNLLGEDQYGVRGDYCERLAGIPGIVAAGIEGDEERVSFDSHPSGGYRSVLITPGRLLVGDQKDIFDSGEELPPMLVGSVTARELGLRGSTTLSMSGSPIRAVVMEETGPRSGTLDRAVASLVAPSSVRGACWVEFEAASLAEATTILPSLFGEDASHGINTMPLLSRNALGPTPLERFVERPDGYLWAILLTMTLLPLLMIARSRREELATYAMFGAAPSWISLVLVFESLILATVASSIAISTLIFLEPGAVGAMVPAFQSMARYLVWLLVFQLVLATILPIRYTKLYELLRKAD